MGQVRYTDFQTLPTRYYALAETGWEYFHIEKENGCERFDPDDIATWCERRKAPIPLPN